jgi:hypothetical protein
VAKVGTSPKSTLRRSIPEVYRARGHRVNNLWLVYSPKTDRDWILPSDRQLVHWLAFLEANPYVVSFDLAPEKILSHDNKEPRSTELDAVVTYDDKHIEWHEVKAGKKLSDKDNPQFIAQSSAAQQAGVRYRIFNDVDLQPQSKLAVRWLKAVSFAAAIRGQEHHPSRIALVNYLNQQKAGYVRDIIQVLDGYDAPVILGLLVRLAVTGVIQLNLEDRTFGAWTYWRLSDQK